ncbi:gas vesicle protein [Streptomyces sp. SAJ15]|nr:gas vesicle protein [Streptomyces sp. SAJ15]
MSAARGEHADDDRRASTSGTAGHRSGGTRGSARRAEQPARRAEHRVSTGAAMRAATAQLRELLGRSPDSVSALKPTDEGWEATVEVVEVERVPDTTSVMASYRVSLDESGDLVAYERTRRYTRGQIDRRT